MAARLNKRHQDMVREKIRASQLINRLDCLTTKSTVREWTSVGSPAGANDITITSTDNKIIDTLSNVERKQIIVQGDRGLSTQITGKSAWTVNNLRGIGV